MSELKPCPFCGATDGRLEQAAYHTDDMSIWSVECLDCGAEIASDASQAEADEHWNRRDPRILHLEAANAIAVEALKGAEAAMAEMFRYYDGGETRGSYDGKPERAGLRKAWHSARAALSRIQKGGEAS